MTNVMINDNGEGREVTIVKAFHHYPAVIIKRLRCTTDETSLFNFITLTYLYQKSQHISSSSVLRAHLLNFLWYSLSSLFG